MLDRVVAAGVMTPGKYRKKNVFLMDLERGHKARGYRLNRKACKISMFFRGNAKLS